MAATISRAPCISETFEAESTASTGSLAGERGALELCKALALASYEAREEFCRAQPRNRRRRCWENVHASSLGWLVYCTVEFSY